MPDKAILLSLKNQSMILFENIEATIEKIDEDWLTKDSFRWRPWKQLYHMLHSIDQWFINPYIYKHPDFHQPGMNKLSDNSQDKQLTKQDLYSYFVSVKNKISSYLDTLTIQTLAEKPDKCKFTRLDLILGQFRHIMYHLGFLQSCMSIDNEELPEYRGLGPPMEPPEHIHIVNRRYCI